LGFVAILIMMTFPASSGESPSTNSSSDTSDRQQRTRTAVGRQAGRSL
jgi:hypothetical protein